MYMSKTFLDIWILFRGPQRQNGLLGSKVKLATFKNREVMAQSLLMYVWFDYVCLKGSVSIHRMRLWNINLAFDSPWLMCLPTWCIRISLVELPVIDFFFHKCLGGMGNAIFKFLSNKTNTRLLCVVLTSWIKSSHCARGCVWRILMKQSPVSRILGTRKRYKRGESCVGMQCFKRVCFSIGITGVLDWLGDEKLKCLLTRAWST